MSGGLLERVAGRIILLSGWSRALAAFVAGAVLVLAHAPYDFFAAGFLSFPVLVWLIDGATPDRPAGLLRRLGPAFSVGWWFGFGYFLMGLWWIGGALLVEAEEFAWALPLAVLGIPLLMAFFHALAVAVARLWWSDGIGRIAAIAFAFGITEWLRGFVLTGFPWNPVGLAAMPIPLLMQSVAVTGVDGMSTLAVFVFSTPALLVGRRHIVPGFLAAILLVLAHGAYGYIAINAPEAPGTKALAIRIVQPQVDLSEKWDKEVRERIFARLLQLSGTEPEPGMPAPELIVWPETAVPFLFSERPDALVAIGELLKPGQMLLTGAVRDEAGASSSSSARYYNSVIAINDRGEVVDAVDKTHLVPFGEYLPLSGLLARFGIEQFVAGPMNFHPGGHRHPLRLPGGITAVPFVCYEIIFPGLVAANSDDTDVLVNVTNDAWFGDTPGPYQHFRQAQVRAVESRLPLLRAANTGISGLIDSRGRVIDALAVNVRGILDVKLLTGSARALPRNRPALVGLGIMLSFALVAAICRFKQGLQAG